MSKSVALLINIDEMSETISLLFQSILAQTKLPDEILIAGNVSSDKVIESINNFSQKISIPIKHIWKNESNVNKSKNLNQIIVSSQSDYIIQISGNSILHKNFIKDHFRKIKVDVFLYGSNRVHISDTSIDTIINENIIKFGFFSSKITNRNQNIYLPSSSQPKPTEIYSEEMSSCNFSFWKKDFIFINGYNQDFVEWDNECVTDLFYRFLFSGVKGQKLKNTAIIYLFPLVLPTSAHLNVLLRKKTKREKIIICENGIKISKPYKKIHLN